MKPALQALPALSIVCQTEDLFGPRAGLYLHSEERGEDVLVSAEDQAGLAELMERIESATDRMTAAAEKLTAAIEALGRVPETGDSA